jgi:hypothetical protein
MAQPIEIPRIDVLPVLDDRKMVLLFDLWVAGKWVGSRRTVEQCKDWLSYLCGAPIEACPGTAW